MTEKIELIGILVIVALLVIGAIILLCQKYPRFKNYLIVIGVGVLVTIERAYIFFLPGLKSSDVYGVMTQPHESVILGKRLAAGTIFFGIIAAWIFSWVIGLIVTNIFVILLVWQHYRNKRTEKLKSETI